MIQTGSDPQTKAARICGCGPHYKGEIIMKKRYDSPDLCCVLSFADRVDLLVTSLNGQDEGSGSEIDWEDLNNN